MPASPLLRRFAGLLLTVACLPLAALADFDGIALPFKEVVVSSPVQGTIATIAVREGDTVVSGQPLVTLETKRRILKRAVDEKWLVVFEHDPKTAWSRLAHDGKTYGLASS